MSVRVRLCLRGCVLFYGGEREREREIADLTGLQGVEWRFLSLTLTLTATLSSPNSILSYPIPNPIPNPNRSII
jgi:hypothetical protein